MRNLIFKTLFRLRVHRLLHRRLRSKNENVVLCFHRVSNEEDFIFSPLRISLFEELMKYVNSNFIVCSTTDFFDNTVKGDQPKMLITFDDGYKDFLENALPILKKNNMPSLHNIIVDAAERNVPPWTQRLNTIVNELQNKKKFQVFKCDGYQLEVFENKEKTLKSYMSLYRELLTVESLKRDACILQLERNIDTIQYLNEMMNWADLKTCLSNQVEIGSHTYSHDSLISIKDDAKIIFELKKSREKLAEKLDTKVDLLAFPNGMYNDNTSELAKECGYKKMFSTKESFYSDHSNEEVVPRISIYHNNHFENIFKVYNFHNLVKGK